MAVRLPPCLLLRRYGQPISLPSAYRIAVAEGLRGARRNRSRYDQFWKLVDWELPDGVLERIWGVWRGNLRNRRLRTDAGSASFSAGVDHADRRFREAVARQIRAAVKYHGPRPR
jgi:hypothetical protein